MREAARVGAAFGSGDCRAPASAGRALLAIASVALAVSAAVFAFTDVVRDKIGGHTGDTIGASEQFAEIAALAALALAL